MAPLAWSRPTWISVAKFLVWAAASTTAPLRTMAQQQYNNPDGYYCKSSIYSTCSTYALYRVFLEHETLHRVAGYFNKTEAQIRNASGLSSNKALDNNATLPIGQPLNIPLDCSCQNGTSQMIVTHTIVVPETTGGLSVTTYGGLTTAEAIGVVQNHSMLNWGDVIHVPIFCACPTAAQIANGTKLLLTYSAIYPQNETLEVISSRYDITTTQLMAANQITSTSTLRGFQILPNTTLKTNMTLLVPLNVSLPPPIAIMNSAVANTASTKRRKVGIIAGVPVVALLALALAIFTARWWRWWRGTSPRKQTGGLSFVDQSHLLPRMFTYKELRKATKSFGRSELLGSGGFGAVYKGILPSGASVAVKRMRMESKHGKESFRAEVASLSHIRHRNLVQLRGWCREEEELLLVFDYMCNGSLDEWLFASNDQDPTLCLNRRHSILSGVAGALAYLHEECPQCVLHRDIKSSNVLLDGDWNAYLGDFGLGCLIDHQKVEKTTVMAGTLGYMAPEMPHTGKATKESDVYSFGVLTLEVVCGTRALEARTVERGGGLLVDRVWRAHEAGNILRVADSRMASAFGPPSHENSPRLSELQDVDSSGAVEEKTMMRNLLHLGLLCCNPNPEERPSMRLASQLLQFSEITEMSLPPLPDYKPRGQFSPAGFSEVAMLSLSWSSSSPSNVQMAAAYGFSPSTPHSNHR